jgi:hypothetical protein
MAKFSVEVGDFFQKAGGIDSKWEVEKIIEYTDIPAHVRLVEHKGNERTQTVAMSVLLDPKYWIRCASAQDEEFS